VVYWFGKEFEAAKKYERAKSIYQQVVWRYPESSHAAKALLAASKMDVLSLIESGADTAAQAALDTLIADFNDHPDLPDAVFVVGEQYYNEAFRYENQRLEAEAKENFRKAIAIWERIITELPPNALYTAQAHNFSAICYRRMGEYEKAIEYFQKIVHDYPDYDYASYAQFVVGRIYVTLKKVGRMSNDEANPKIVQAYENILQKYPDSKWVKPAKNYLEWTRKKASHKETTNEE
jgi:outer membrane protein assembly factor BamD (BamD/ComL family)